MHGRSIGTEVAASGLGNEWMKDKTVHSYYQWVPFTLFFQVRSLASLSPTNIEI